MRNLERIAVVTLAMVLVASACSGDREPEDRPGPTALSARQELTVGALADEYVARGPSANVGQGLNIAETLLLMTSNYEVKPLLAERYELRSPNTWRFFLRRDVKFHDGRPFNAQAVKEGLFDRMAKVPLGGTIRAGADSASVVDEFTIDFTPVEPNLRVPEQIVHPANSVAAPGTDFTTKPVGTGPFRFVEYRPDERFVVERNPEYWGERPKLDRITYRFLGDDNTRRLALESGEIDLMLQVPFGDVKRLRDRGFQVVTSTVGAYTALYMSLKGKPPFDQLSDRRLRQAVASAIDTRAIVSGVLDNKATNDKTMVPPALLGPHASMVKGHAFDLARARSLLDQAGWRPGPDGIRLKDDRRLRLRLTSGFPSPERFRATNALIQSQLKEAGIELEIDERPDIASYGAVITARETDIAIEQGTQNDANPLFLPVLLFFNGAGAEADYVSLYGPGPRFDQVIASTLTEPDIDKARRAAAEAMRIMIDEEAIVVPLAGIPSVYGAKTSVQGFEPFPSGVNIRWDRTFMTG